MKRDMDLLRRIMLYLEESYNAGDGTIPVCIPGIPPEEVWEHCRLLYQSSFIESFEDASDGFGTGCRSGCLTSAGYEFLSLIHDDEEWEAIRKAVAERKLPLSISSIEAVSGYLLSISLRI